jgi:ADP-ribosyl-[dinitrogen reductase] hydrolase
MSKTTIGPLLACAIADAYGAGFEYVPPAIVRANNDLTKYLPHPKWSKVKGGIQPGSYTDDAQMAMGLAEHMLEDDLWNLLTLADRWVGTFKRDERTGYARGFYSLLREVKDGAELVAKLRPISNKNGGAMRAFPIGFLPNTQMVRDLAMLQASLTHASWTGMTAAAGAALMFHHRYHCVGLKEDLPFFLDRWLPGAEFSTPWKGKVGSNGINTVRAALAAYMNGITLGNVLHRSVAFTGDVDTVAAIAMPVAAVCEDMPQTFPSSLVAGLENGTYGGDYIAHLDELLIEKFPREADREAGLEAARQVKRDARAAAATPPEPENQSVLEFLLDDED